MIKSEHLWVCAKMLHLRGSRVHIRKKVVGSYILAYLFIFEE